ncbi:hypothetical protein T07_14071 [Trichinella nelsoni]|uniref:Uncharacterized protein n=1 Tax=Trichinella nelsoni TaxID=6336 RepID=A0A0V0SIS1_9BILA|nr:hypothetical protein T07_14071 [Trichinella nelsoni]
MISHVRIERSDSIDNQHSIGSMTNYNMTIHMHCIGNMGSIETLPNGIKRKISQKCKRNYENVLPPEQNSSASGANQLHLYANTIDSLVKQLTWLR